MKIWISIFLFFNPLAFANVGEFYGLGSRNTSLSSATIAGRAGAFSGYINPAQVADQENKRLSFAMGVMYAKPAFKSIDDPVVKENDVNSDTTQYGSVNTSYPETFGQVFGLTAVLFPEWHNLSVGLVSYLPIENNLNIDTTDPYLPEYILYRTRTQRPQVDLAMGAQVSKGFLVGGGVEWGFSMTTRTDLFIQTDQSKSSSMRVSSSVKSKFRPYFGLLKKISDDHQSALGLVFRFPLKSPAYFEVDSGARALSGGPAALNFNYSATSTLQYDPLSVEFGLMTKVTSHSISFLQLEYQRWSQYQASAIEIKSCESRACGVVISNSSNPSATFRDIYIPKLGHEIFLNDDQKIRFGYSYRMGVIKEISTGENNQIDPNKHLVNLGFGQNWKNFLKSNLPVTMDVNFSLHYLESQSVKKASDSNIGSPGYDVGGFIYGGGVTFGLEI